MWNHIVVVYYKEFIDALRDRNAMFMLVFLVVLLPGLIGFLVASIADRANQSEEIVSVNVVNAETSPSLLGYLEKYNIEIDATSSVSLIVADDFVEKITQGVAGKIRIGADLGKDADIVARLRLALRDYSVTIGSQRLFTRGISPSIIEPIDLQLENTVLNTVTARRLLDAIVYFLLIIPVIAAAGIAIDTTAGERERLSLEPLLVQPVDYYSLIIGKWLALLSFALMATAACVFITLTVLKFTPLASLGISMDLSLSNVLIISLILLPFICMITTAQLALALYAKSFKEGQTYLTLISFVPIMVSLIPESMTKGIWLPIVNELTSLKSLLLFQSISVPSIIVISVIELLIAFGLITYSVKQLNKESILQLS